MNTSSARRIGLAVTALLLLASACGGDQAGTDEASDTTTADSTAETDRPSETIDPAAFLDGALTEEATTVDCTLSDGTESSCYELTVAGFPANRDEIGPWCPETTSSTAEDSGIWFDGEASYDVDGQFILDLAEIYDDPTWKLYDDEGNVLSTDSSEAFNDLVTGGANPDPDAEPVNLCVYGEIEWADGGGPIAKTVTIPVTPTMAESPVTAGGTLGVTLDGVPIEGSAPIDLILGNYTIGVFDDCGGHVNPQEGYHLHGTTGCSDSTAEVPDGETAAFGYALDGYAIHAPYDAEVEGDAGLDECNGHETSELGYHYHANRLEQNEVLPCFSGETTQTDDGGAGGPPGDGGPPDAGGPPDGGGPPQGG